MPEGSEIAELQRRGLNISGFAGAHPLGGGYCHGAERDHSTALAWCHGAGFSHSAALALRCDIPAARHTSHGISLVDGSRTTHCDVAQHKRHEVSPVGNGSLAITPIAAIAAPAATSTAGPTSTLATLPTVAIGKRELSFEAHSVQDLEALADARLLWDIRCEETVDRGKRG